jgi:hypothetical protein
MLMKIIYSDIKKIETVGHVESSISMNSCIQKGPNKADVPSAGQQVIRKAHLSFQFW